MFIFCNDGVSVMTVSFANAESKNIEGPNMTKMVAFVTISTLFYLSKYEKKEEAEKKRN